MGGGVQTTVAAVASRASMPQGRHRTPEAHEPSFDDRTVNHALTRMGGLFSLFICLCVHINVSVSANASVHVHVMQCNAMQCNVI